MPTRNNFFQAAGCMRAAGATHAQRVGTRQQLQEHVNPHCQMKAFVELYGERSGGDDGNENDTARARMWRDRPIRGKTRQRMELRSEERCAARRGIPSLALGSHAPQRDGCARVVVPCLHDGHSGHGSNSAIILQHCSRDPPCGRQRFFGIFGHFLENPN